MDDYILKHLQDIMDAIAEIDSVFEEYPRRFDLFEKDVLRVRLVERNVEIMGEAINRVLKYDPTFVLPNAKEIINTRNRIIHGYDSVTKEFLWGLVRRHIPALRKDVQKLLEEAES